MRQAGFDPFSVSSGVLLHHHDKISEEALSESGSKKTLFKNLNWIKIENFFEGKRND